MINNHHSLFIRRARRKDRFELKACNERNLQENYDLSFWETPLERCPWTSWVLCETKTMNLKGYLFADESMIISLAIDAEYRHQGWGTKLLQAFIQDFNQDPNIPVSTSVQLHVRMSNQVAIKMYQKQGFNIGGSIPDYYLNPREGGYLMTFVKK